MAPPIRIGPLDEHDAHDLSHALSVRGLVGSVVGSDGRYAVVVHDSHEEAERLFGEVTVAVEAWVGDRGEGQLEVRMRDRVAAVAAAPETISAVLMEQTSLATEKGQTQPV
jgi:hypothetical protein